MSVNKVFLLGNLTEDPELRYTSAQTAVCECGLAVNERVKKNGEWTEDTTFVDVTYWGRSAEILGEYAKKGSKLHVEGRLKLDQWERDGQKRQKLGVVCEKLTLLSDKART